MINSINSIKKLYIYSENVKLKVIVIVIVEKTKYTERKLAKLFGDRNY